MGAKMEDRAWVNYHVGPFMDVSAKLMAHAERNY